MVLGALADLYRQTILFVMYALLLSLFIALGFVKWRKAAVLFAGVQRKTWLWLLAVFLVGAVLRFSVFPTYHMMYVDESLYMGMASNLNHRLEPVLCVLGDNGRDEMCWLQYQKPPGWSFLISLGFLAFGEDEQVGFFLSALFGSLSILLIFFLCFLLFRRERAGLWAAALLAFFPLHIIWSHSAETNVPAVFFILLVFLALLVYRETADITFLFLFITILFFSFSIRYEHILLVFLIIILPSAEIIAKFRPKQRTALLAGFLAFLIFLTMVLMAYSAKFFSIRIPFPLIPIFYLFNLFPFLKDVSYNYLYLALALPLIVMKTGDKKPDNVGFFALGAFLILSVFAIFFYSSGPRMALVPSIFLILLASLSLDRMSFAPHTKTSVNLVTGLVLFILGGGLYVSYYGERYQSYPNIDFYPHYALETESSRQIRETVPQECTLIAEQPVVIEPTPMQLIRTSAAIMNPEIVKERLEHGGCVYYFSDAYCLKLKKYQSTSSMNPSTRCSYFLKLFSTIPQLNFVLGRYNYTLFKVTGYAPLSENNPSASG